MDDTFETLLCAVFSDELIQAYKRKRSAGFIDLMIAFESRKRSANPNKTNSLNVALPFSFIDFYRKNMGSDVSISRLDMSIDNDANFHILPYLLDK